MIKIDKIYTKGGDSGKTSLGNGDRVDKSSARIEAFGFVDEANSILGIVEIKISKSRKNIIREIQNDLFDLGADLCVPENRKSKHPRLRISKSQIIRLENKIDLLNKNLETLKSFILPGGSLASAYLHLARASVRTAERKIVELSKKEVINPLAIKYINRLSDLLFVIARIENKERNIKDTLWKPGKTA